MKKDGQIENLEAVDHQVLVKLLAFLTVLEEHELAVPVHEDQENKTYRIQQWHRTTVKESDAYDS